MGITINEKHSLKKQKKAGENLLFQNLQIER